MADVKWIKIATDIFADDKILLIESLPDSDSIIVIWFKLLCMAGKQNNCGVFMMNDRIAYTDEMLATIFRRNINTVRLALRTFEQYGMIEIVNNAITIPNWEKHQQLDALEKSRDATRKRVAKHRAKQKLLAGAKSQCNVTETVGNADREDKNREDKSREDKSISNTVVVDNISPRAREREETNNNNNNGQPDMAFNDGGDEPSFDTLEAYAANNIINMNGRNMEFLVGYKDILPEPVIRYAIDLANKCCKSGVPTYSYVEKILMKYARNKIQTVEQAQNLEKQHEVEQTARSAPRRKTVAEESDDYWSKVPFR